ncbi:MAG: glycoside hydrolase family 3 C-terminal domain-containing protein [Thermoproteota archaeon]
MWMKAFPQSSVMLHREVARRAVRESIVLLKNNGILPIPKNVSTIFVAGPNANDIGNQCGGWTIT